MILLIGWYKFESVSFDASVNGSTPQYVTNSTTNYQYKWNGTEWIDTYQDQYKPVTGY